MPLLYELDVPPNAPDDAPVIVLLHGRGSDRFDLLGLRRGLPSEAILVAPQAPFPGAPWGYGPGWAWYRYLGDDRPEPESFEQAQTELAGFLGGLSGILPVRPGPLALGGFSQGGTMSLGFALRNPGHVPAILNFSGFLPNHPSVEVTPERVRGSQIFWGHGTLDPSIPFTMAERGRARLREVGADLTTFDARIGHSIDPEELEAASDWLDQSIAGRPDNPNRG